MSNAVQPNYAGHLFRWPICCFFLGLRVWFPRAKRPRVIRPLPLLGLCAKQGLVYYLALCH